MSLPEHKQDLLDLQKQVEAKIEALNTVYDYTGKWNKNVPNCQPDLSKIPAGAVIYYAYISKQPPLGYIGIPWSENSYRHSLAWSKVFYWRVEALKTVYDYTGAWNEHNPDVKPDLDKIPKGSIIRFVTGRSAKPAFENSGYIWPEDGFRLADQSDPWWSSISYWRVQKPEPETKTVTAIFTKHDGSKTPPEAFDRDQRLELINPNGLTINVQAHRVDWKSINWYRAIPKGTYYVE